MYEYNNPDYSFILYDLFITINDYHINSYNYYVIRHSFLFKKKIISSLSI